MTLHERAIRAITHVMVDLAICECRVSYPRCAMPSHVKHYFHIIITPLAIAAVVDADSAGGARAGGVWKWNDAEAWVR